MAALFGKRKPPTRADVEARERALGLFDAPEPTVEAAPVVDATEPTRPRAVAVLAPLLEALAASRRGKLHGLPRAMARTPHGHRLYVAESVAREGRYYLALTTDPADPDADVAEVRPLEEHEGWLRLYARIVAGGMDPEAHVWEVVPPDPRTGR